MFRLLAQHFRSLSKHTAFLLVLVVAAPVASAADPLLPVIPKAVGEKCVEPTDDMRKNHMNYLLHQRDETMHRGVRTKRHSLKGCIDCHVQRRATGSYPRVSTTEHFCNSCHTYASVSVDCFQCHADRPEEKEPGNASVGAPDGSRSVTAIQEHIEKLAPGGPAQ